MSRVARLLLAVALGWTAVDLWVDRLAIAAGTDPVHDPTLWLLTALMVYGVFEAAGVLGARRWVLGVLGGLAVGLATVTVVSSGTVWTAPLTWLVWALDFGGSVFVVVALLVAVVIGTPGCEIGVVRELLRRREPAGEPMFCLAGLRALDEWERRMPWHRAHDRTR